MTGWVTARFLRPPGPGSEENAATADDGAGAAAGASASTGSASGDVRVQFDPGTTGAELTGQLMPQESRRYVLGASNRQNYYFRLAANGLGMTYVVYDPDGSILLDETGADREYRGQFWQSGDHIVDVYNTSNDVQS